MFFYIVFSTIFLINRFLLKNVHFGPISPILLEKKQKVLTAALRIDQVAGNPLLEYFKMSGNQVAANDLRFWNAATRMLTDDRFYGPLERKRLCRVLVSLYLDDEAEFAVSLTGAVKRELSDVLMRDIGVTKLMEACVAITKVGSCNNDFDWLN